MSLAAGDPALALVVKRPLLMVAKCANALRLASEKLLVLRQPQRAVLDAQRVASEWEIAANLQQFLRRDRIETQLVEKAQQPGLASKIGHLVIATPHLQGAADKLIATRAFHAVNAQIRSADAHRVFRRPGSRRVVFGGDQPMARIKGVATGAPR